MGPSEDLPGCISTPFVFALCTLMLCTHFELSVMGLPAERKLLQPGTLTVVQTAQGNPDLSTLVSALTKTGLAGACLLPVPCDLLVSRHCEDM